ncbi:MAG: asparagine synthase (glutamine-hydrolyzing) [bacterium]|nr:asparagine synthase (glutamine-hydrolyzing) [bacterium]
MCGIAGVVNGSTDLTGMVESLRHRGPDDSGFWLSEDKRVALGHTRLAVLDLSLAGHQPMTGAGGQVALVYNGEIYNYPDLRRTIEAEGCVLRSDSDTEILLELYLREGIGCLNRLVGMFAFALYDGRTNALFLARDRAGKKPLYWSFRAGQFVFASEIKALCDLPGFEPEIDPEALLSYLQLDYLPTPKSIYKGVQKLRPGHYLCLQGERVSIHPFWELDPVHRFKGSYGDALEHLDVLLDEAVRCRLISDVPLGVFLSGGLDSSAITYYATQHHPRIKTFSIAFDDPSYDESNYAARVAEHLGTNHSVWQVTASDLMGMLTETQLPLDEPLGDSSIVPTFLLAQKTRQEVTVALGGDGGDELFAGYPTFQAEAIASRCDWIPRFAWQAAARATDRLLKPSSQYLSPNFKMKQFLQGMVVEPENRHQRWLGSFSLAGALSLFNGDMQGQLRHARAFGGIETWGQDQLGWHSKNGLLHEYFRTYLMDEVMVKVDRASMAASLEARSPFLDHRVVEFAFSLPYKWKFSWGRGKILLKDRMQSRLPTTILRRAKKGFGMPISSWLKTDLADWTRAQLAVLDQVGIVPQSALALHDRHLSGQGDLRKPLWNLIALALFLQHVHPKRKGAGFGKA